MNLVARDHSNAGGQGYGRFYGDITCYLGFNSYRESGKTMGLASFCDTSALAAYEPFFHAENGEVILSLREEAYVEDDTKDFKAWFAKQGLDMKTSPKATQPTTPQTNQTTYPASSFLFLVVSPLLCHRKWFPQAKPLDQQVQ